MRASGLYMRCNTNRICALRLPSFVHPVPVAGQVSDRRKRGFGTERPTLAATELGRAPTLGHRPRAATPVSASGFVRCSGDAVSKLDWAGDGAERLEAFAGAKDLHIAIVEHAPEN